MMAAFWLLLAVIAPMWRARGPARPFVLAGCAALAVGTLQGPVQAFPAVNELLDAQRDAGDVIVNLHAQLNMLGGLDAARARRSRSCCSGGGRAGRAAARRAVGRRSRPGWASTTRRGSPSRRRRRTTCGRGGLRGRGGRARAVVGARARARRARRLRRASALYARATWRLTAGYRRDTRACCGPRPGAYTGGSRGGSAACARRRSQPTSCRWALLGFPGVGWLFAGFPVTATILLARGPALAWALIPLAFSPFGDGPLRAIGWRVESCGCRVSAPLGGCCSIGRTAGGFARLQAPPPRRGRRARTRGPREAPVRARAGAGATSARGSALGRRPSCSCWWPSPWCRR